MSSHFHGGPHHTSWADLISVALQTQNSAEFKPCQNHQTFASVLKEVVRVEGVSSVGSD